MTTPPPFSGPQRFPWGNLVVQYLFAVCAIALFILAESLRHHQSPPTQTDYLIAVIVFGSFLAAVAYFGYQAMRRHRYSLDGTALRIETAMGRVVVRIPYEHLRVVRLANLLFAKRIYIKTDEQEEWIKGNREKFPSRAFYHFTLYPGSIAEAEGLHRFLAARMPKQDAVMVSKETGRRGWVSVLWTNILLWISLIPVSAFIAVKTDLDFGVVFFFLVSIQFIIVGVLALRTKEQLAPYGFIAVGRLSKRLSWIRIVGGVVTIFFLTALIAFGLAPLTHTKERLAGPVPTVISMKDCERLYRFEEAQEKFSAQEIFIRFYPNEYYDMFCRLTFEGVTEGGSGTLLSVRLSILDPYDLRNFMRFGWNDKLYDLQHTSFEMKPVKGIGDEAMFSLLDRGTVFSVRNGWYELDLDCPSCNEASYLDLARTMLPRIPD